MKKSVERIIDDLAALRSEPLSYDEHNLILKEIEKIDSLQLRAHKIAEAANFDLDTAWDMAKAERLIIDNGFHVDLARIIGATMGIEKEMLVRNIKKEYGGAE